MTDKIMQVLSSKYLIRPIYYEGLQRKEPLEIPEDALREIIFNSIVHKLQFGTWNQMSIYDDHIRLWNEGVLPENYTVETLMSKHTSKPRNPKMAQVFYRAGFIEAWGRGYEKIMKAFDKANLKRPEFTVEQGGVTAIIYREIFMSVRGDKHPNQRRTKTDTEPIQTDTKPIQNRTKSEERTIILGAIKENPLITMDALSDLLKITKSSVQRRLEALVKDGKLRHIGPTKGGSWEVLE
ncbi:winged helix-turn-helix transcriptional regulator [Muribaculaceae bacterium Isolate-084 (Janvier)]|nr:winged helix-turn-helix transcriptional regulator [Muribaculaceae bacterium Isolate-084 (Janvier)]